MTWVTLVWVAAMVSASNPVCLPPIALSQYDSHSTVSSVSPPPGLWGLVDDNVSDNELINSEVLGVGVGLGVLQQAGDESDRLLGPSTFGWLSAFFRSLVSYLPNPNPEYKHTLGLSESLGLASSSDGSVETSERNDLLVLDDIGEVGVGLLDVHA